MFNLIHYRFRICLRALQPIFKQGYLGSAFRGLFGHALKKIVCPFKEAHCSSCLLRETCHYLKVFETPQVNRRSSNGTTHLPHPFLLIPPLRTPLEVDKKELFFIELVLLKTVLPTLPYILLAFEKMGQMGMSQEKYFFTLESVDVLQAEQWQTIFHTSQGQISKVLSPCFVSSPKEFSHLIKLSTCTPLRIKQGGHYLSQHLPFSVLMRRLLRRLDDLNRLYGDGELPIKTKELLNQAETIMTVKSDLHWVDVRRYSNRQQQRLNLGGLEGSIYYGGDFRPFLHWLAWGQALHVGQATSFGFGKYQFSDGSLFILSD